MTNDKKILGVSTIAVIALILIAAASTYAFFKGTDASDTDTPLQVTTNTVDSLIFNVDTDITMVADMSNFTEGKGNREGVAHATATLKANNKTNSATGNYYLYFDIKENELTYTTEAKTAELLLQVSGPDGLLESGDIIGLKYVTVTDGKGQSISGFDITEVQDLITIASNKEITTTSEKLDNWEIKVILVNLDADQTNNGGKKFNSEIIIQKYKMTLGEACRGRNMVQCISNNYTLENNIYYHDSNLENGAGDNSYRYAGSYENVNNYVCFGSSATTCPHDNLYRIIGVFDGQVKLIKADYAKSSELGTNGDYIKTYAEFEETNDYGTNKEVNTKEEIGTYSWNNSNGENSKNIWAESRLNKDNLNGTYLNNFSDDWQSKIAMHDWQVGGNKYSNIISQNAKFAYQNEILNSDPGPYGDNVTIENKKIGLMYASDYGYAAIPSLWLTILNSYNDVVDSNWMSGGLWEWTITRESANKSEAFHIHYNGRVINNNTISSLSLAIRPCFYLTPEVTLIGGSGTQEKPYLIN